MVDAVDLKYYGRAPVAPTAGEFAGGLAFIIAGFGISWGISRMGKAEARA